MNTENHTFKSSDDVSPKEIIFVIFLSTNKSHHQIKLLANLGIKALIVIYLSKKNGSKNLFTVCQNVIIIFSKIKKLTLKYSFYFEIQVFSNKKHKIWYFYYNFNY